MKGRKEVWLTRGKAEGPARPFQRKKNAGGESCPQSAGKRKGGGSAIEVAMNVLKSRRGAN